MKNILYRIILSISFVIIIFMEIKAFSPTIKSLGLGIFIYYTEISNFIALISAVLGLLYLIITVKKDLQFPFWLTGIRFLTTTMLLMTMLITIFVLVPHSPQLKNMLLFEGSCLYHHTLVPILSIISYIILEPHDNKKRLLYIPVIATFLYGLVMVILNALNKVSGPYFFLKVNNQPLSQSVIWLSSLLLLVLLFAFLIWISSKLINKIKFFIRNKRWSF